MPAAASISPFASNAVESREDLQSFLVGLLDALESHTSPGGALIHLGHTATHYDETAAQLEGFSRPIWGLSSLLAGGGTYAGASRWVNGFASGTNPSHAEFWGDMRSKDQRMVECAAIGFSIAVAKEQLWDPLPLEAKTNFENWLGGMNDKQMPDTNWLWFRVSASSFRQTICVAFAIEIKQIYILDRYLQTLDFQELDPPVLTKLECRLILITLILFMLVEDGLATALKLSASLTIIHPHLQFSSRS